MSTLDTAMPDVPMDIFSLSQEDADLSYHLRCEELWTEVCEEILDQRFMKRSHHNVGTYDQDCRGPLCRKALREHPRRKSPAGTALSLREERIFDPVLEYFHVVMKHRVRIAQQEILRDLKEQEQAV